jgi:hypothetical protein
MESPKSSESSKDLAIKEAEEAGFDLKLLELNLSLSPKERIAQHDSALELVLKLEVARKGMRDENSQ